MYNKQLLALVTDALPLNNAPLKNYLETSLKLEDKFYIPNEKALHSIHLAEDLK
jgi:hypothetical protein